MQGILKGNQEQSYGQLILMKNFRPRSFSICPLDLSEDATTKELIIARFGLSPKITIDLVNLHLHSSRSRNADGKRCRALEHLFQKLNTNNYMLIGDFNFGDYDTKEQNILQQHEEQIHDLWTKNNDLAEVIDYFSHRELHIEL
jgi:endonuclease/exonuclease/phosphatase family metal-dependent hydrolase